MRLANAGYPSSLPATTIPILNVSPDSGVQATIGVMVRTARDNAHIASVQELGLQAASRSNGDLRELANSVHSIAKHYLRFRSDESSLSLMGLSEDSELLIAPSVVAENPGISGDCDDFSTFIASLLIASHAPIDVYFVTIAADATEPARFSHVYVGVVLPNGDYLPIDASHGAYAGWEHNVAYRKHFWLVSKGTSQPTLSEGSKGMGSIAAYNTLEQMRGLGDVTPIVVGQTATGLIVQMPDGSLQSIANPTPTIPVNTNQLAQGAAGTLENVLMTQFGTPQLGPASVQGGSGTGYSMPSTFTNFMSNPQDMIMLAIAGIALVALMHGKEHH